MDNDLDEIIERPMKRLKLSIEEKLKPEFPKYQKIVNLYHIQDQVQENFNQNTPCLGCQFNAPGQRDHMIPPHGCLYEEA